MASLWSWLYDWLLNLFWATKLDIAIVGIQNAGKTSLVRVLAGNDYMSDSIPTVGFNMKTIRKGHVTLNCWDVAGQPRFRESWTRYCADSNAIIFVVDCADREALPIAREELDMLLSQKILAGIPLLVLGNKADVEGSLKVDALIEEMDLKRVSHRGVSCYCISVKTGFNFGAVVKWLEARAGKH